MKKNLYQTAIGIFIILTTWSCDKSSDNEVAGDGANTVSNAIELKGRFYSYALTDNPKDDKEMWLPNLMAGVFMLQDNTSEPVNNQSNISYKSTTHKGAFEAVHPENVLVLPDNGNTMSVVAYTPWKEGLDNNKLSIDCSRQSDELNIHYARTVRGINKKQLIAELEFYPVLVKTNFILQAGAGVPLEKLKNANIDIIGMNTIANLNLLNGKLEDIATSQNISISCNQENKTSAMILPSTSVDGYKLIVTLPEMDNETREWELSQGNITTFSTGMEYTFTITILPSSIEVKTDEHPIGEWGTGNSSSGHKGENNLVKVDINELPEGDIKKITNLFGETGNGEWFYYLANGQKGHSEVVTEEDGSKAIHSKVETSTAEWWSIRFGYHMQADNILPEKYILEFKVKGTKGGHLWMFVNGYNPNASSSFMMAQFKENKAYGGHGINIEDEQTYQMIRKDFDFSQTSNSITWRSDPQLSTEMERKNFSIGFFLEKSTGDFYIKDLKLYRAAN